jgi:Zn-finger nucleic acid-binding protein
VTLERCPSCHGLWLAKEVFDKVLESSRGASVDALLGVGGPAAGSPREVERISTAGYVPCPDCGSMMNRNNFARRSGVIVDVCKAHGTWFDAEELGRIIAFARAGGIEDAQRRDAEQRIAAARQSELDAKVERRRASLIMASSRDERGRDEFDAMDFVDLLLSFFRARK